MGKYSLTKKEPVISAENAHASVMKILERYNIDIDSMDEEKQAAYEQTVDNVVKCFVNGDFDLLEENGELKIKQFLRHTSTNSTVSELVYAEARGKDHIAMKKEGNEQAKMLSLLSSMCETNGGAAIIEQLRSSDLTNAEYLSLLFL